MLHGDAWQLRDRRGDGDENEVRAEERKGKLKKPRREVKKDATGNNEQRKID